MKLAKHCHWQTLHSDSILAFFSPTFSCKARTILIMFARLFRRTIKRNRLSQSDNESLDDETLLPSSSTTSLMLKPILPPLNFEYQVVLKTLMVCSVVYLSVGVWIAHTVRRAEFVTDADEFCIHHVSQYCKTSCRR